MPSGPGEGFGAPKTGKKGAKGDFRGIKHGSGMSSSIPSCSPRWLRARAWPIVGVGSNHPQAALGPPGAYAPGGSSTNSCVTTYSHCAWTNEGSHVTCISAVAACWSNTSP